MPDTSNCGTGAFLRTKPAGWPPNGVNLCFHPPIGFLVIFGLTFWLASFDWIMSLEPHWYSTIFGVYHFAGLILGGLAMITILAIWLERLGPLRGILTEEHLHDLGKLLFAFSTFWIYIWFCQYLLIWYANIPEETSYFIDRVRGFWGPVFCSTFSSTGRCLLRSCYPCLPRETPVSCSRSAGPSWPDDG